MDRSRLLDALDSSMASPSATQGLLNNLRSSLNTPPASTPNRSAVMEARSTQMNHLMSGKTKPRLPEADGDAQPVLGPNLNYSPRKSGKKVSGAGGFALNYDDETPIRAIDIGGQDQHLRMAEFVTQSINNASHGITVNSAIERLGLEDVDDVLPGMNVRLLKHQTIGVAWMLEKEHGKDKGGILADDMGLGKTVQMIATMAMNQPSIEDDDLGKTTLIIVPAALMQQWKEEIETKTNGIMSVHIHHGKDKLKKRSDIKQYDAIITTYQTLNGDFNIPKDLPTEEEADWLSKNGGILARTKFFRAIADEAQFIRNRSTRSSISLAHIKATYRWMLTGTPVTNTLADIYGLLRFGRFRPWNDWNDFNQYVAKMQVEDPPVAGQRAQTILAPLLMRRTKDSQLEGEPILKLKPKLIELVKLEFPPDERDCYDSFEKQSKMRLNKFIREKTLLKNHAFVLVMILRLRQLCCHPYLILSQTGKYDNPTALMGDEVQKERDRATKIKGRTWVEGILKDFLKRARANEMDYDDEPAEDTSCPCSRRRMEKFSPADIKFVSSAYLTFELLLFNTTAFCKFYSWEPINLILISIVSGEGTEKENLEEEKRFEEASAKGLRKCPTCHAILDMGPEKIFKAAAFEPTDEEIANKKKAVYYGSSEDEDKSHRPKPFELPQPDDSDDDLPDLADIMRPSKKQKTKKNTRIDDDEIIDLTMDDISEPIFSSPSRPGHSFSSKRKSPQPRNGKGKAQQGEETGKSGLSAALLATWSKADDDMEPSVKMMKLVEYIKSWEKLGDKTIWTSMLDLIEVVFSRYGIQNLRYDGQMNRSQRDRTLALFKKPDGPKVILISTKSGGVGLNLVAANRIVNMDLSWNYAAESQAYDRAHRIGQEKTVYVKRLVVSDTIEERLLQLQDVKVGLAEAALGEGSGTKLTKLSMKDIKFLFGMTKNQNGVNKISGGTESDNEEEGDDE
ncbi:hypothetical protein D9757_007371 [Collybiopsis confluens]|uniref:Uncharacterized protein n=1 Tax=Collybiopsis confluens TaxID=2823264 RepID=A0A8H5M7P6_9AGAR|nr:hypothetical protein D9757_007371 [Collybiopsis confluens]